ncbi:MAG: hypothetical protein M1820_005354 [Bogoriella megaspora]|nr:MAG: hypothetical protein M1820_005354 [Bogoriella megaspora]
MASTQPEPEASPSPGKATSQNTITIKILSPSPEIRNGIVLSPLSTSTTVGQVKQQLRERISSRPPNERQRLIYRGRVMMDESQTLLNVFGEDAVKQQREHTLHLVIPDTAAPANSTLPNAVPRPNPFRPQDAERRAASVPPGPTMFNNNPPRMMAGPGANPQTAPFNPHQLHQMHQQQIQRAQQFAAGLMRNHGQGLAQGQNGMGQGVMPGQQGIPDANVTSNQASAQSDNPQIRQSSPAHGLPPQNSGTHTPPNHLGQRWTVTVNATTAFPQQAGQIPFPPPGIPMPMQTPFGHMPGQNVQHGQVPVPMGLPFPPVMQGMQPPNNAHPQNLQNLQQNLQNPDILANFEDTLRRAQELQEDAGSGATNREETLNILSTLHNAIGQLRPPGAPGVPRAMAEATRSQNLHNRQSRSTGNLAAAFNSHPNNLGQALAGRATEGSTQHPGQGTTNAPHNHGRAVNSATQHNPQIPHTIESTSNSPTVYLLSSPAGPQALLVSQTGMYTTPGGFLHPTNTTLQQPRNLSAGVFAPAQVPLNQLNYLQPVVHHPHTYQNVGGVPPINAPGHPAPTSQVSSAARIQQQQHAPMAIVGNNQNQGQPPQPAPQRQHNAGVNMQPGAERIPELAARVAAERFARNPDPNAQAEGQRPNALGNLGDLATHLWVIVRILGFLWLFFGGSDHGFVRPIMIGLFFFLAYAAQQQGPVRRFGERVREHVEGLLRPEGQLEPGARARPRQQGNGNGQPNQPDTNQGEVPANVGARGQPMPDPAVAANRLLRTHAESRRTWLGTQLRGVERAIALFLASLWPGVGERHVQVQERERHRREEEALRQQREREERENREETERQEEAARQQAEEEARRESEASNETVGLRSHEPSDHDEGLRGRRQAMVEDDSDETHSTRLEDKGKAAVRDQDSNDLAEGSGTGSDAKGSALQGDYTI